MQSHNFGFTVLKGWRLLQGNIVGFMWLLYLHDFIAVVAVDPTFENSVSRCKAKQAAAHHMLVYCSDPVQCWCSTISLVLNIISFLLISPLILLLMHYMKHSGVNFHHHSKDLWGVFLFVFLVTWVMPITSLRVTAAPHSVLIKATRLQGEWLKGRLGTKSKSFCKCSKMLP